MTKSTLIIGAADCCKWTRAMELIGASSKWVAQFLSIDDYIVCKFLPDTKYLLFKGLDVLVNPEHQNFITRLAAEDDVILSGVKYPRPEIIVLCDGSVIDTPPECFLNENWIIITCTC